MGLFVTSLNSGSNGNCYYVGTGEDAVLVDVGISCREVEKRLKRLGLFLKTIKAIFVSHEHADHISGIAVLAKKYKIPVFITPGTLENGGPRIEPELLQTFAAYKPIQFGDLSITAFPKFHDAADPHSFIVSCGLINVGVFTDIGTACEHVIKHFSQCHAAFLESNYDEQMLDNGGYPVHLKRRIKSKHGHLSNAQALDLFLKHRPPFMTHLFLSHLSRNNNRPELVRDLFSRHANGVQIVVAPRYSETPLYEINGAARLAEEKQARLTQLELIFE